MEERVGNPPRGCRGGVCGLDPFLRSCEQVTARIGLLSVGPDRHAQLSLPGPDRDVDVPLGLEHVQGLQQCRPVALHPVGDGRAARRPVDHLQVARHPLHQGRRAERGAVDTGRRGRRRQGEAQSVAVGLDHEVGDLLARPVGAVPVLRADELRGASLAPGERPDDGLHVLRPGDGGPLALRADRPQSTVVGLHDMVEDEHGRSAPGDR